MARDKKYSYYGIGIMAVFAKDLPKKLRLTPNTQMLWIGIAFRQFNIFLMSVTFMR